MTTTQQTSMVATQIYNVVLASNSAKPLQFTAPAFRFAVLMHLPITSDRRQATAKRIHDLVAIVRSTAEYKS